MEKQGLKEEIRQTVLRLGADVCGVAHVDEFGGAPAGFHPRDLFPACRSVIVFGIALPKGLYAVAPDLMYGHFNENLCPEADRIALQAAKEIERLGGGLAVPLPADDPYEYWQQERLEGRGLLSMKHAAVLAGLGALGKSSLLLNESFGNRLVLGAVLADLALASDPPAETICAEGCRRCIESCPAGALDGRGAEQKKCRPHTYGTNARGFGVVRCNLCRVVCPVRFSRRTPADTE